MLGSKLSWQSLLRGINFIPFNLLLINKSKFCQKNCDKKVKGRNKKLKVVFFWRNKRLWILTSFQVLCAPKSWSTYFFNVVFKPFLIILDVFKWYPLRESTSIWVSTNFKELLKTLISKCFSCFWLKNHWKMSKINKKGWKWHK